MMRRRYLGLVLLLALLGALLPLTASVAMGTQEGDPPGHCPDRYEKIWDEGTGNGTVDGKSWTADADYTHVILVGGPPGDQNDDPDGRDKPFTDVEAGETISREAHDISHICAKGRTVPPPADPIISVSHAGECGAAEVTLKWENASELTLQYGITVEVDGVVEDSNLLTGPGSDTINLSFTEDQSDGEVDVRYYFTDATEWDYLADQSLNYQATYPVVGDAFKAFTVDTDCEAPTTTTEAPTTTTEPEETTSTTEPEGETTSTTLPPPEAPTTTTTDPGTSTTMAPPETTTPDFTTPETLPFTGPEDGPLAAIGGIALLIGSGLLWLTRGRLE